MRSLTVLQTHVLNSGIGIGHHCAGRSGPPCPCDLNLTLGWAFRLQSPEDWLPSPPDWGPHIPNVGLWLPPMMKLDHMDLCRTLLAGETSMTPKANHIF